MINTKNLLEDNNIEFILDYGTLLGAYRDNKFIPYDTDIDVSVYKSDYQKLYNLLDKEILKKYNLLKAKGPFRGDNLNSLKLINFNGKLMTENILRSKGEIYIDIYKINFRPKTDKYKFYNTIFNIPTNTEKYLEHMYGENWKTPIKNKHANWPYSAVSIKNTQWFKNNSIK